MRYAIVIKNTEANYAAQVPDLPGCVTTVATVVVVKQGTREAIELHMQGLREDGRLIPKPSSAVEYVGIAV